MGPIRCTIKRVVSSSTRANGAPSEVVTIRLLNHISHFSTGEEASARILPLQITGAEEVLDTPRLGVSREGEQEVMLGIVDGIGIHQSGNFVYRLISKKSAKFLLGNMRNARISTQQEGAPGVLAARGDMKNTLLF